MSENDVVVIGASAGGVEAMRQVVHGLPADLDAAVFVVMHMGASSSSALAHILARNGPLPARQATDGEPIVGGQIYVARPDFHLLIDDGHVCLSHGPRENSYRPAVDALFRSAAEARASHVIGVVLSGALDDGSAGLLQIKRSGGVAMVQDPADALFPSMPQNALDLVDVDYTLSATDLGPLIGRLVAVPVAGRGVRGAVAELVPSTPVTPTQEVAMARGELPGQALPGPASGFTCPECGGALWEFDEGNGFRFRCQVGHGYAAESLFKEQGGTLEAALWTALRAIQQRALLARRLAGRASGLGHKGAEARFEEQARELDEQAETIRRVLVSHEPHRRDPWGVPDA
ncbi:MAG: two-component system, chemotaxis family, protein-glutamate methylesterase/glutaminase [Chloroflexota bacterium]|nr:two-component system, chemotaxis family, protein-glutamate methylesterase/glutaminase [Chloroflexota bacterium]